MIVVGVGCGPGMLTEDAISHIRSAKTILGSRRAIDIAMPFIHGDAVISIIKDYSNIGDHPEDAVMLSTGDPMLAGLGYMGLEVIPGISSMQLAFSRLRLPLTKAIVVDAHGKEPLAAMEEAAEEISRGRIPFMLTGPGFDTKTLALILAARNLNCKMIVCENLGYPNETISFGTPHVPPCTSAKLFSLILVKEG